MKFLQILYTGDFSRQEDRHLMAAEIPTVHPDVLITVSIFSNPNLIFNKNRIAHLGINLWNAYSRKTGRT